MGGIAPTTTRSAEAETGPNPPPRRGPPWRALVGLVLAVALLTLSVPRLLAGVALIPGDRIKQAHMGDRSAGLYTTEELAVWHDSRRAALAWADSASWRAELALTDLLDVPHQQTAAARIGLLRSALELNEHALAASANQALVWMRLAAASLALGMPSSVVLDAVGRSIEAAPYQPEALYRRVVITFHYWSEASAEQRDLAEQQIALMAPARRWNEIKWLARRYPEKLPDLRRILADDPTAQKYLDIAEQADAGAN